MLPQLFKVHYNFANILDQGVVVIVSVKGPELITMYVGQSEENIREGELYNHKCFFQIKKNAGMEIQPQTQGSRY